MKLRNKKTGEILETGDHAATVWKKNGYSDHYSYNSLAELNEDWEDYNPTNPLIKDKKIRKVVRAWAEAERATNIRFYQNNSTCEFYYENTGRDIFCSINFIGDDIVDKSLNLNSYTIAELCGDEDE